ncbi:MAG: c(7)-type cytochrome triheme domain-containing protein [Thermodesulfobacteriota bacterium]
MIQARKLTAKSVSLAAALLLTILFALPALSAAVSDTIVLDSKIESMKKAGMGAVSYPHAKHLKAFKCNDCHPKIFKMKHGENDISMRENMKGKFCGSEGCHNSPKAFPLFECNKCHAKIEK